MNSLDAGGPAADARIARMASVPEVTPPTVLGPRHRFGPRPPRAAVAVLAAWAAGFALTPALPESATAEVLAQLLTVVGVVSACWIATWAEAFLYYAGRARGWRVAAALVVPVAAATIFTATATLDGLLERAGYRGDLLLVGIIATAWLLCSFAGSALIMLLDAGISAVLGSFRNRVRALVLVLMAFGGLMSVWGAPLLFETLRSTTGPTPFGSSLEGALAARMGTAHVAAWARSATAPELPFVAAVVVLVLLPAVLSATAKFAGLVMERIYPLIQAFGTMAEGKRSVWVEEGGSAEFVELARRFNGMVARLGAAERMESAFGRYVNNQLIERIRAHHGDSGLPTSVREATVFFADIRGFTAMSESLPAEAVVELLNLFFARAVDVVDAHEGYLNKFLGDALMVVFNGPFDQPDHRERAVRCAIALQEAIATVNADEAFPHVGTLSVGVGVASGPMVCGNVGGAKQMEYTVIGDVVNTAARLAAEARGGEVWMTRGTAASVRADVPTRPLPSLTLRGREGTVEVAAWPAEPVDDAASAGAAAG